MNRYGDIDPDDARDLMFEDAHDAKYGPSAEPRGDRTDEVVRKIRARFIEMTTGMVTT